jgi:hypothetical protein
MDETDHSLMPGIQGCGSEQENQSNQRSTQTTPAPVRGLRTDSYCTENEGTPIQKGAAIQLPIRLGRMKSKNFP